MCWRSAVQQTVFAALIGLDRPIPGKVRVRIAESNFFGDLHWFVQVIL